MSRVLTRYIIVDDVIADARRAREEEWMALHRRPDALPLPAVPERARPTRRLSIATLAHRVTRPRFGS
jgi:hypothetical protein